MFWSDIKKNRKVFSECSRKCCTAWHQKASIKQIPQRNKKRNVKKVYPALTEKHLGSIHKGLEGDEKVEQVGARDAKMYKRSNNVCVKKIL